MNKNIDKMISVIIEDQKLCEALIRQKSLEDAYEFYNKDYTRVKFKGKWGIINKNMEFVIPPEFLLTEINKFTQKDIQRIEKLKNFHN